MGTTRRTRTLVALLLAAASAYNIHAHVGGHGAGHLDVWKVGRSRIHATLHSFRGDSVVLEGRAGHLHVVHVNDLDAASQDRVRAKFDQFVARVGQPVVRTPANVSHVEAAPIVNVVDVLVIGVGGILLFLLMSLILRSPRKAISATLLGMLLASVFTMQATFKRVLVGTDPLRIDSSFAAFKPGVATRWDDTYFYVESDGMPTEMSAMVGITAWQQQVPIPQMYRGTNAWSIPLLPVAAAKPVSLDTALHTGAVAIAVNGLPIFNPENNRGEFSYDIGELDAFGGHCGRADDYHYHIAPVHLAPLVGSGQPIAWALDGYPLYGYAEPDGTDMLPLDANLGHIWQGEYHYHATKTRPYMIAAMRGVVTIDRDQVMPQAQTKGVRPFLQPLNNARIVDFHRCDSAHYALKYTVNGQVRWVNYRWAPSGQYTYVMVNSDGSWTSQSYQRK